MTATERPSLEARAREWLQKSVHSYGGIAPSLTALLESVAAEERAFADTRLQTAVTTMEQATQAMLEAQAEVVELRAALAPFVYFADAWDRHPIKGLADELYAIHDREIGATFRLSDCMTARKALARPQPEAILRVLRAAIAWRDAEHEFAHIEATSALCDAVQALPEGVREVLK